MISLIGPIPVCGLFHSIRDEVCNLGLCIYSTITSKLKFGRDNSSDFLLSHSLQQASALISSYVSPGSSVQQAEARDGSGGHHHHGHHAEHGEHHHVDHAAAAPVSDICILVLFLGFEKNTN